MATQDAQYHGPNRIRAPRAHITYDVEIDGAFEARELPFVVGVLADFSFQPLHPLTPLRNRKFVLIDREVFDRVMSRMDPRISFKVDDRLSESDGSQLPIELHFGCIEDFEPQNVALQIPSLRVLVELRQQLLNLRSHLYGNERLEDLLQKAVHNREYLEAVTQEIGFNSADTGDPIVKSGESSLVLDRIIEEGQLARAVDDREIAKEWLKTFFDQVATGEMVVSRDTETMLNQRVLWIDSLLSRQLNEILHAPDFQKVEATWRGLYFLVTNADPSSKLKIRILNVAKRDLLRDLRNAVDFDQSVTFKKIYDEEYGTLGGEPFSLLIGDFEFSRHGEDMEILEKMSNIAAEANAPFIAAASPAMFNWESFIELSSPKDLSRIFDADQYIRYKSFRDSDDSRYVGLVLPRILLRSPYKAERFPAEQFGFDEDVTGHEHQKYLWGNSAYAFAVRVTSAFAQYGWCGAIQGLEGGGLVGGLPLHEYQSDEGDVALKCPTEMAVTDRRESELVRLGFIPLCHAKGTDKAVFFSVQSCHKPKLYVHSDANVNANLVVRLDYILATSRFAHYMKVMMRDKMGKFKNHEECEAYLNGWIASYVLLDDSASMEQRAKYPLREARIEVLAIPGRARAFKAIAHLKPHFQLDDLTVPMRLRVSLPQSPSS